MSLTGWLLWVVIAIVFAVGWCVGRCFPPRLRWSDG